MEFYCEIDGINYDIYLSEYEEEPYKVVISYFDLDKQKGMQEEYEAGSSLYEAIASLKFIKNYAIEQGAICR